MGASRMMSRAADFPSGPGPGECHVWAVTVSELDAAHAYLLSLLGPAERARAIRYRDPAAMRLHVASRAAQRLLAGHYLGCAPANVRISRRCPHCGHQSHGRPVIAAGHDGEAAGLDFSVTHSGGLLLLAYVGHGLVGIDVEAADRRIDRPGLVDFALTGAEAALLPGEPAAARAAAFHRLWTRKEAVLKLTGYGLALPLRSIDVSAGICRRAPERAGRAAAWPEDPIHVRDLRLSGEAAIPAGPDAAGVPAGARDYIAAVATTGSARKVGLFSAGPLLAGTARRVARG